MGEKRDIFILITMGLLLIVLITPVKAFNFDEDLLLYLSFDKEDKVVKDETDKTKGGTVVGDVEWVKGKIGNALELDGAGGYLEVELTPELTFAEKSSFTAEVYLFCSCPQLVAGTGSGPDIR